MTLASTPLDALTDDQRKFVMEPRADIVLRACPGSGKTHAAVMRFLRRIGESPSLLSGIAMLSFTNVAVDEVLQRSHQLGITIHFPHFVGTLDAFMQKFLIQPHGHREMACPNRPFLAVEAADSGDLANEFAFVQMEGPRVKAKEPIWKVDCIETEPRPRFRAGRSSLSDADHARVMAIKRRYAQTGRYTHADASMWAYNLLKRDSRIVSALAARFPEIIVDEAQDTSAVHRSILTLLMRSGVNVTIVGDPDQCIYEFNAADARFFQSLITAGHKPYELMENKRSTRTIVNSFRPFGTAIGMFSVIEPTTEDRYVAIYDTTNIISLQQRFSRLIVDRNLCLQKCAIVVRSHSQLAQLLGSSALKNVASTALRYFIEAAVKRDDAKDYPETLRVAARAFKVLAHEFLHSEEYDRQDSDSAQNWRNMVWAFARSPDYLPQIDLAGNDWHTRLKASVSKFLGEHGFSLKSSVGVRLKTTGIDPRRSIREQFGEGSRDLRIDTIHQVKGETLSAVTLVASSRQEKHWIEHDMAAPVKDELVRLAYVAMTRPQHLLVVAVPRETQENHLKKWESLGFVRLNWC